MIIYFGELSKNFEYKIDHFSKNKSRKNQIKLFFHRFQNIARLLIQFGKGWAEKLTYSSELREQGQNSGGNWPE